jgi:hypothetical protein
MPGGCHAVAPEFEHPWKFEYFFDHLTMTGHIPTERQTLLDLLTAKDLAENKVVDTRWVPPYKQHAGYLTKLMLAWLWVGFTNKGNKGLIPPRETTEEAQEGVVFEKPSGRAAKNACAGRSLLHKLVARLRPVPNPPEVVELNSFTAHHQHYPSRM